MSGKKVPETKWCAYCGTQAPGGAVFCPHCGEPIDPNYVYDEGTSSEEAVIKEDENSRVYDITFTPSPPAVRGTRTQVMYEGTIRGLVTAESEIIRIPVVGTSNLKVETPNPFILGSEFFVDPYRGFAETIFVMRLLGEGFEEAPDEILVQTRFGYFGKGDEVVLHGRIFKKNLRQWGRPMYAIIADHFYNESLQIGDGWWSDMGTRVLYPDMMQGSVTKEPRARRGDELFRGTYFAMKLDEKIGVKGFPDEILVRYNKAGYFGVGDRVILQGEIVEKNSRQWGRPSYSILADRYYNESLQIGDEESMKRKQVLHKGMIRGSVTKESIIRANSKVPLGRTLFTMKLEEDLGISDEILVKTYDFGYFGKSDKVILQGKILEANLRYWDRPMYTIRADYSYNESLQFGEVRLTEIKRVLYIGTIQGSVTGESKTRVNDNGRFDGTYFAMRLEGDIGIGGNPDKLLVRSERAGYFRKGDEVVLQGRIIEANLRRWNKPMYLIIADHYYNKSLQIGD